ncbi:MAG TPA: hypothetical protein VFE23_16770 [Usitatibacter sp.]|jgi:hypothetical protein|nr:hypothetical protein [Usitatibacter sp.]
MKSSLAGVVAACAIVAGLPGCYYGPYPYGYPSGGESSAMLYDRSWNALLGAFADQGVEVYGQDRTSGVIDGRRGGMNVRGHIVTQADGRVRVEYNTSGTLSQDPGLPDRISQAYEARMGR